MSSRSTSFRRSSPSRSSRTFARRLEQGLTIALLLSAGAAWSILLNPSAPVPSAIVRSMRVNDEEDDEIPGVDDQLRCPVCGGPHEANPDDCPVILSKLIYEKGMQFPRRRLPPPSANNETEDDGN